jgi:hypothetical protein
MCPGTCPHGGCRQKVCPTSIPRYPKQARPSSRPTGTCSVPRISPTQGTSIHSTSMTWRTRQVCRGPTSAVSSAARSENPRTPTCLRDDSSAPPRCCGRPIARWPTSAFRWGCRASVRSRPVLRAHSGSRRPRTEPSFRLLPTMRRSPRVSSASTVVPNGARFEKTTGRRGTSVASISPTTTGGHP